MKKSFIDKYSLDFPEGYVNEDLYFHYASIVNTDRVFVLKGPNYHYRSREDSISNTMSDKDIKHTYMFSFIYDYYNKNNLLEKGAKIFSVMPYFNVNTEEKYMVYKK